MKLTDFLKTLAVVSIFTFIIGDLLLILFGGLL